ncbi:MAG: serine protease [Patescibacteria group bacterium]
MNDLSKQQLILLALLVSFVTSLATGIFTVSLMSQAPQDVVQTINNVVERIVTHEPNTNLAGSLASMEDRIPAAVSRIEKSIVRLTGKDSDRVTGIGLVVSREGVVMADKSVLERIDDVHAIFADGRRLPMSVVQSQNNGDIAFLAPVTATSTMFTAIVFASAPKLGQEVLTLSSDRPPVLAQGIVSRSINPVLAAPSDISRVDTSISSAQAGIGSPLFTVDGEVIGMGTASLSAVASTATFYPVGHIMGVIPKAR